MVPHLRDLTVKFFHRLTLEEGQLVKRALSRHLQPDELETL